MKRPLALIGITYLSTLAVAFYYLDNISTIVFAAGFLLATFITLFLKIDNYKRKTAIVQFVVVILAFCSSLFYTNFVYQPTVNRFDGTKARITATLVEEPRNYYNNFLYPLETQTINGKAEKVKINLICEHTLEIDEFDKIACTIDMSESDNSSNLSKKIFFTANTDYYFSHTVTHTEEKPLYYYAIKLRQKMSKALDSMITSESASLCKAVLLGDKYSMPNEMLSDFSDTGVTFLIVVSGMHLVVICSFVLFVVEKITKNRLAQSVTVLIFIFAFMAVTGFTPSIVRAGTMAFIVYMGKIVHRNGDSLNSLGLAALVLTVANPYAVGDVGLLLSFTATAGIILWCKPITDFIMSKFKKLKHGKKIVEYYVGLFSASLSASLWVIPITVLYFGKISPYSVVISVIVSPFVSAVIVCSLLTVVFFYIFKFIAYPFAMLTDLCSRFVVLVIGVFADLPFAYVKADRIYFYVWVATTFFFAVFGYFVKNKGRYIKYCIIFSICVLVFGYSFYTLVDLNTTSLVVYNTNGGITALVRNGDNSSIISCGGKSRVKWKVINDITSHTTDLDFVIVPSGNNDYNAYFDLFQREFDVSQFLLYDSMQTANNDNYRLFGDNESFSIHLNNETTNSVINIDGNTCQHLQVEGKTVLIAPQNADLSYLPKEYRKADFLLSNGLPENTELLECDTLILTVNKYEITNKAEGRFKEVICVEDKITVDIS
ncbi:MAG: ComEC/Rec2 family competence protein [Ruminococcus sp.]|nr:ComEC/Rec2 family competence protein [Ruminococcus sp.]